MEEIGYVPVMLNHEQIMAIRELAKQLPCPMRYDIINAMAGGLHLFGTNQEEKVRRE